MPLLFLALLAISSFAQRQDLQPPCTCGNAEALALNREALQAHLKRRLEEASTAYAQALRLAPPRELTSAERERVLRFAPRVMVSPTDPFPLKDAAAVLHPNGRWIAYHFFWEDDIDFPDDNDPCDHELMWVELDARAERVLSYYTYFHGRILKATETGPPAIVVQWGKHGSMPANWKALPIVADSGDVERSRMEKLGSAITLESYNRATFEKLGTVGRQSQDSPLARGWPLRFNGTWEQFTDFSKPVDIPAMLRRNAMMSVSCLNNAVINRHFLRYNFASKTEWPAAMCEAGAK